MFIINGVLELSFNMICSWTSLLLIADIHLNKKLLSYALCSLIIITYQLIIDFYPLSVVSIGNFTGYWWKQFKCKLQYGVYTRLTPFSSPILLQAIPLWLPILAILYCIFMATKKLLTSHGYNDINFQFTSKVAESGISIYTVGTNIY